MTSPRIEQFKKLVEIEPSEITFFGLGRACMDEGYFEEAAEAFRKAIELKPDYTAVYLLLGESLQHLNRPEEAMQVYEQGVQVGERTRDEIPKHKMEKRLKRLKKGGASSSEPQEEQTDS